MSLQIDIIQNKLQEYHLINLNYVKTAQKKIN